MTIREAVDQDASRVAEIWNDIIRNTTITFTSVEKTYSALVDSFAAKKAAGQVFLVLEIDDVVQGFATYGAFRDGPGYAYTAEHSVYLAPAGQGLGWGRDLLRAVEHHAKAAGIRTLVAGVSGENTGAVAFHQAMGYVEMARLKEVGRKFDRWLDMVLMQKML